MIADGFHPSAPDAVTVCPVCGAMGEVDYGRAPDGRSLTYVQVLLHDESCPDYEPPKECPF